MNLNELVSQDTVVYKTDIASKKRALEQLATLLAGESGEQQALDIFQHLTEREKLGSTSLGHGVALPHARTGQCTDAKGAFIKLDHGINFDSPDGIATDMLFALLVPEHYTDEHLKILAELASLFSDDAKCEQLRKSTSNQELYNNLTDWNTDTVGS